MRKWRDDQLIEAVKASRNISEVITRLYDTECGGHFKTVWKYVNQLQLDVSHFSKIPGPTGVEYQPQYTDSILCENSSISHGTLRAYLLRNRIIPYTCILCNNDGYHNGNRLVLQLDHINGIKNDNRTTNLRFLCPNCHSQTKTFGRKSPKPCPKGRIGSLKSPCPPRRKLDHSKILSLYEQGISMPIIAHQFGVKHAAIRYICKKSHMYKGRNEHRDLVNLRKQAISMVNSGHSRRKAASLLGASNNSVARWIREQNHITS